MIRSTTSETQPKIRYGLRLASAYRKVDKQGWGKGGMDQHFYSEELAALGIFDGIGDIFANKRGSHIDFPGYISEMALAHVEKRRSRGLKKSKHVVEHYK